MCQDRASKTGALNSTKRPQIVQLEDGKGGACQRQGHDSPPFELVLGPFFQIGDLLSEGQMMVYPHLEVLVGG